MGQHPCVHNNIIYDWWLWEQWSKNNRFRKLLREKPQKFIIGHDVCEYTCCNAHRLSRGYNKNQGIVERSKINAISDR